MTGHEGTSLRHASPRTSQRVDNGIAQHAHEERTLRVAVIAPRGFPCRHPPAVKPRRCWTPCSPARKPWATRCCSTRPGTAAAPCPPRGFCPAPPAAWESDLQPRSTTSCTPTRPPRSGRQIYRPRSHPGRTALRRPLCGSSGHHQRWALRQASSAVATALSTSRCPIIVISHHQASAWQYRATDSDRRDHPPRDPHRHSTP